MPLPASSAWIPKLVHMVPDIGPAARLRISEPHALSGLGTVLKCMRVSLPLVMIPQAYA
jgi:hypothetical protein